MPIARLRSFSGLALGSAVSGLLAYVFFALVTRVLGAERAAPVSVLWAWWSFTGAGLTFPLQHWIARTVAASRAEGDVRRALGGLSTLVAALALVTGVLAALLRERLFHEQGLAFPALAGLVVLGSGLMGVVRGVLTARRRFRAVAAGLVAENGLRCVAALALVVADVEDPAAYGLCLVLGYVAAFGFPGAFRLAREGGGGARPLAFLGAAGSGQLLAQAVLTGGPVLLAAAGGAPAEVTALFAGLALFRAPYTLGIGVLAPVTERVTRLVVQGHHGALRRLRLAITGTVLVGVAAAVPVGAWLGPPLVRLVFGHSVRLSGAVTLLIAVGTVLAIGNLVLTVVLMALNRATTLGRAWLVGLVPGAAWFALADTAVLERTAWTFVVVEATAWLAMSAGSLRPARQ